MVTSESSDSYSKLDENAAIESSRKRCDWIGRKFDTYLNRIQVLQQHRSDNAASAVASISFVFHFICGGFIFVDAFNLLSVDNHIKPGPIIMALINACVFTIPIFGVDTGTFMCWVGSVTLNHKDFMVALALDGFFELLGKLQSSTEADHNKLVARLYHWGFLIMGVIICQIHLRFRHDHSGITNGAIVAVGKALLGFGAASNFTTWIDRVVVRSVQHYY